MAKCVRCGRKLPLISFGALRNTCRWCRQHEAAERGDVVEYQKVMPAPWQRARSGDPLVTYALFGINAAVFVAMSLAGASLSGGSTQELVRWGANFGPYTVSGQWWRLVTSMFVHIGILHIALNMWCLWDLGALAESLYGRWTFLGVYLLTGVAASITSITWHPMTVSAGASGAIFGITGALIASFKLGEFSLPRGQIQGVLRSVVAFAAYNLVFGAISARTDNSAHIGGLVMGLVLGAGIAKLAADAGQPIKRITLPVLAAVVLFAGAGWLYRSRAYLVHMQRAERLIQTQGKEDEAIAELQRALRGKPNLPRAHYLLAIAYGSKGHLPEAEREWRYLLERNPKDNLVRYNLGLTYLEAKRPADAREQFSQMLATDANSAEAHFGLGLAFGDEGDNARAAQELQTAASIDPELPSIYYNLGAAYARLQQYDNAILAFQRARDTDGDHYQLELALAHAYQAKGMKQEATTALARAEELKGKRQDE